MSINIDKGYCAQCKQLVDRTESGGLIAHTRPDGKKCANRTASGRLFIHVGEISLKVTREK